MTPEQLRHELQARGFRTQTEAGEAIGVSQRQISAMLLGNRPIRPVVEKALAGIPKVQNRRSASKRRTRTR